MPRKAVGMSPMAHNSRPQFPGPRRHLCAGPRLHRAFISYSIASVGRRLATISPRARLVARGDIQSSLILLPRSCTMFRRAAAGIVAVLILAGAASAGEKDKEVKGVVVKV